MHAPHPLAGNPLLFFFSEKLLHPMLFDKLEIFDLAHSISLAIAGVEALEEGAREGGTGTAKCAGALFAEFDGAKCTRLRRAVPKKPASRARIFCSQVPLACAAVHAAWRDHFCAKRFLVHWSFYFSASRQ